MNATLLTPTHGGPDALGVPAHDLSTNANACGPWPVAVQALRTADARHYPDPAYTALRVQLGAWHGVAPARIVLAASGSEFIQRISVAVALNAQQAAQTAQTAPVGQGAPTVWLPPHAYGDYARAAQAAGLPRTTQPAQAALLWACDPSSPLGQPHTGLAEQVAALTPAQILVLDQAYEPLRLDGALALDAAAQARIWRMVTPNKALGLTGVRAAYAIAPSDASACLLARVHALAPSWPVGTHGVALLQAWATVDAHDWLATCRDTLRTWKTRQIDLLCAAGWQLEPSAANFLVATPAGFTAGGPAGLSDWLAALRTHGFKLRDCASFGLPGRVRLAVVPPEVQDALLATLHTIHLTEEKP